MKSCFPVFAVLLWIFDISAVTSAFTYPPSSTETPYCVDCTSVPDLYVPEPMPTTTEDFCEPCCEKRSHGQTVIVARINRCIDPYTSTQSPSSSSIDPYTPTQSPSSSTTQVPTTTEAYCEPCCETRPHGYTVIVAEIIQCIDPYTPTQSPSSSSIDPYTPTQSPSSSSTQITTTTEDYCEPCCETRSHGHTVIVAKTGPCND